jgi:hypothetical protein
MPVLPANELVSCGIGSNAKDADGLTTLDYSLTRARIGADAHYHCTGSE